MERILLVGGTSSLNENIAFVLQLAGFEVSLVQTIEEAINLNDIHRCFIAGFDMLVIASAELLDIAQKGYDFLKKIPREVKILIAERTIGSGSTRNLFDSLYQTRSIYFCDTTNITVEAKRIFGRN
jgi:hypothetical protein